MTHPRLYVNCGPITELRPVLEKWRDINRNFYMELNDDCPWWYNERASISILAAAAWQTEGFYAIEEFSTTKGRKRAKSGTLSERPGRCDLKIWTRSKQEFVFEAKQAWCKLDERIDLERKCDGILTSLAKAKGDARRLKTKMGRRLGTCFLSPRILSKEKDNLGPRLDDLLHLLINKKHHDAIAWFFVDDPSSLEDKETRLLYPGTVLLLKEVKK